MTAPSGSLRETPLRVEAWKNDHSRFGETAFAAAFGIRDLPALIRPLRRTGCLMQLMIWSLSILLLCFWSFGVWALHAVVQLALTMPWEQAIAAIRNIEVPAMLQPVLAWFGADAWIAMVESLAPLAQWTAQLLKASGGWFTSALPVLAWVIWAIGALFLVALTAAGSLLLWLTKRGASKLNVQALRQRLT